MRKWLFLGTIIFLKIVGLPSLIHGFFQPKSMENASPANTRIDFKSFRKLCPFWITQITSFAGVYSQ
ncbi:hypothetical protein CW304_13750 [Bacillus sp. UFRGS-B20]|nr:hypothetical protein CW304_13750 [Bacillus sp. UFRGS-B20]